MSRNDLEEQFLEQEPKLGDNKGRKGCREGGAKGTDCPRPWTKYLLDEGLDHTNTFSRYKGVFAGEKRKIPGNQKSLRKEGNVYCTSTSVGSCFLLSCFTVQYARVKGRGDVNSVIGWHWTAYWPRDCSGLRKQETTMPPFTLHFALPVKHSVRDAMVHTRSNEISGRTELSVRKARENYHPVCSGDRYGHA